MVRSIEEKVEEYYKNKFDEYGIRHFGKTESINDDISNALSKAESKSGGKGNNYPDIQLLLDDGNSRRIPVMIEAKGVKNKLEKLLLYFKTQMLILLMVVYLIVDLFLMVFLV